MSKRNSTGGETEEGGTNRGVPTPGEGERREWTPPELEELPPLRDLTLLQGQSVGGTESVFT